MSAPKTKAATELQSLNGQVPIFPVPLDLQRFDGETVRVTIHCKAFPKRVWARMRREHVDAVLAEERELQAADKAAAEAAAAEGEAAKPGMPRLDELMDRGVQRDGVFFAQVAQSWSLPEPCDAEGLMTLDDNFGDALTRLLEAYERAIYQGQLGNFAPSRGR